MSEISLTTPSQSLLLVLPRTFFLETWLPWKLLLFLYILSFGDTVCYHHFIYHLQTEDLSIMPISNVSSYICLSAPPPHTPTFHFGCLTGISKYTWIQLNSFAPHPTPPMFTFVLLSNFSSSEDVSTSTDVSVQLLKSETSESYISCFS